MHILKLSLMHRFWHIPFFSLEAAGLLRELANYLDAHIPSIELIAGSIGVVSAIIDNVPLVAATMGMYDLTSFPQDSEFWQLVAYCVGTGGSMLVIGSAAGVAFMGMEKVDFFWYFRKVLCATWVSPGSIVLLFWLVKFTSGRWTLIRFSLKILRGNCET